MAVIHLLLQRLTRSWEWHHGPGSPTARPEGHSSARSSVWHYPKRICVSRYVRQLNACLTGVLLFVSCSRTERDEEIAWRAEQMKAIEARVQLEKLIVLETEIHQEDYGGFYVAPRVSFTIENRTRWVIGEALFVATVYDSNFKPIHEEFMCNLPGLGPGQKVHAAASPFANWAVTRKARSAAVSVLGLYSRDRKVLASASFPYNIYPAEHLFIVDRAPCFASVN